MMRIFQSVIVLVLCNLVLAQEAPREWIDPDTGHRVVRLSSIPGSQSLYFHQNPYTPDGKHLLITTPNGISAIDLATHEERPVVEGRVRIIIAGYKTGDVYYTKDGEVFAASVSTGKSRRIASIPEQGTINSVNADETLLAGTITHHKPGEPTTQRAEGQPRGEWIRQRFEAHLAMEMFVIDTKTGQSRVIHKDTEWLNHVQFSPTDPSMLMFCHEGPWERVNRTWLIDVSSSQPPRQIHQRTMEMEIEGHEWFAADGKTLWYDLQTPRGEVFWVAGYELATGKRTWYHLQRNEWSVHFNTSPDGTLFAGDGGSAGMVAKAPDGKWIYLFRPKLNPDRGTLAGREPLIRTGVFESEKLVNMAKHDYTLEPNVTFTPDMKWIVFRSNMHGASHAYAVEIAKK